MIHAGVDNSHFDSAALAKIGHLELLSKKVVDGVLSGKHRSKQKGGCYEFAEHRPYSKGDELRLIDWHVLAKTDRYYIKQFEEETNLQIVSVVDCSGSMEFGLSTPSKLDFARIACACLSRLMLRQRDAVGLAVVDQQLRNFVPPRSSANHLTSLLELLRRAEPKNATSLAASLLELARRLRRRGLLVIFSDCFTELEPLGKAVRQLQVRGHEVLLFHTMAPEEIDFAFSNWTRFECMESGTSIDLDAPTIRKEYRERVSRFLEDVRREFTQQSCEYVLLRTDQDVGDVLAKYLARRAAGTKQ